MLVGAREGAREQLFLGRLISGRVLAEADLCGRCDDW